MVCRLLGYATGAGNYRVQDVDSKRVFISRDVVFDEGLPRRTSASVGEKTQVPLFDDLSDATNIPLANHDHAPIPAINDDAGANHPLNTADHADQQGTATIPAIPVEPR